MKPSTRRMARTGLMLIVISILLPLVVALLHQLYETQAELHQQRKVTQKYASMLASAMNGKVLHDRISGQAFFFDKPLIVRLGN